jgi:oligopeptide/dipeptide ABC transporter ATP-binding protein
MTREQLEKKVGAMLQRVGLPEDAARRYPAQFSGGQRQRIAIARALMLSPRLVICDEPVSSLDLSIQAQVLNLLRTLQKQSDVSYLFIAHDLDVVRHISHRIVVLYRGKIMEHGRADVVSRHPVHPYTRALLAASPVANPREQRMRRAERIRLVAKSSGEFPSEGCPFMPRCPFALERCQEAQVLDLTTEGSYAACIRKDELPAWRSLAHVPRSGESGAGMRLNSTNGNGDTPA